MWASGDQQLEFHPPFHLLLWNQLFSFKIHSTPLEPICNSCNNMAIYVQEKTSHNVCNANTLVSIIHCKKPCILVWNSEYSVFEGLFDM